MTQAERAAGAVRERNFAILDLPRTAFAAQLFGRLDHEENSAHARMVRRQAAAISVDRKLAVETQPSTRHKRAAFATLAEAEVLQRRQHRYGERVVDHRHVDVFVGDARALEGQPPRLRRRYLEKVALPARRVAHGLARAENIDRLLLQIAR